MKGDQLTWHWDVPDSHPYARGIRRGWDAGFSGADRPKKADSDAELDAYEAGVRARRELHDEHRRFGELRVSVTGDGAVAYELTERRGEPA